VAKRVSKWPVIEARMAKRHSELDVLACRRRWASRRFRRWTVRLPFCPIQDGTLWPTQLTPGEPENPSGAGDDKQYRSIVARSDRQRTWHGPSDGIGVALMRGRLERVSRVRTGWSTRRSAEVQL